MTLYSDECRVKAEAATLYSFRYTQARPWGSAAEEEEGVEGLAAMPERLVAEEEEEAWFISRAEVEDEDEDWCKSC